MYRMLKEASILHRHSLMGKYGSPHSTLPGLYLLQDKWAYHLTSKVSPPSTSLLLLSLPTPSLNHSRSFVVLNKDVIKIRGIGKVT